MGTTKNVWMMSSEELVELEATRELNGWSWELIDWKGFGYTLERGTGDRSCQITEIKVVNTEPCQQLLWAAQRDVGPKSSCDVHLICDDGYVPVHSIFIQNALKLYPKQNSILEDALKGVGSGSADGGGGGVISITLMDVKLVHLKAVITLLYRGQVELSEAEEVEVKGVMGMLQLSEMWEDFTKDKVVAKGGAGNTSSAVATKNKKEKSMVRCFYYFDGDSDGGGGAAEDHVPPNLLDISSTSAAVGEEVVVVVAEAVTYENVVANTREREEGKGDRAGAAVPSARSSWSSEELHPELPPLIRTPTPLLPPATTEPKSQQQPPRIVQSAARGGSGGGANNKPQANEKGDRRRSTLTRPTKTKKTTISTESANSKPIAAVPVPVTRVTTRSIGRKVDKAVGLGRNVDGGGDEPNDEGPSSPVDDNINQIIQGESLDSQPPAPTPPPPPMSTVVLTLCSAAKLIVTKSNSSSSTPVVPPPPPPPPKTPPVRRVGSQKRKAVSTGNIIIAPGNGKKKRRSVVATTCPPPPPPPPASETTSPVGYVPRSNRFPRIPSKATPPPPIINNIIFPASKATKEQCAKEDNGAAGREDALRPASKTIAIRENKTPGSATRRKTLEDTLTSVPKKPAIKAATTKATKKEQRATEIGRKDKDVEVTTPKPGTDKKACPARKGNEKKQDSATMTRRQKKLESFPTPPPASAAPTRKSGRNRRKPRRLVGFPTKEAVLKKVFPVKRKRQEEEETDSPPPPPALQQQPPENENERESGAPPVAKKARTEFMDAIILPEVAVILDPLDEGQIEEIENRMEQGENLDWRRPTDLDEGQSFVLPEGSDGSTVILLRSGDGGGSTTLGVNQMSISSPPSPEEPPPEPKSSVTKNKSVGGTSSRRRGPASKTNRRQVPTISSSNKSSQVDELPPPPPPPPLISSKEALKKGAAQLSESIRLKVPNDTFSWPIKRRPEELINSSPPIPITTTTNNSPAPIPQSSRWSRRATFAEVVANRHRHRAPVDEMEQGSSLVQPSGQESDEVNRVAGNRNQESSSFPMQISQNLNESREQILEVGAGAGDLIAAAGERDINETRDVIVGVGEDDANSKGAVGGSEEGLGTLARDKEMMMELEVDGRKVVVLVEGWALGRGREGETRAGGGGQMEEGRSRAASSTRETPSSRGQAPPGEIDKAGGDPEVEQISEKADDDKLKQIAAEKTVGMSVVVEVDGTEEEMILEEPGSCGGIGRGDSAEIIMGQASGTGTSSPTNTDESSEMLQEIRTEVDSEQSDGDGIVQVVSSCQVEKAMEALFCGVGEEEDPTGSNNKLPETATTLPAGEDPTVIGEQTAVETLPPPGESSLVHDDDDDGEIGEHESQDSNPDQAKATDTEVPSSTPSHGTKANEVGGAQESEEETVEVLAAQVDRRRRTDDDEARSEVAEMLTESNYEARDIIIERHIEPPAAEETDDDKTSAAETMEAIVAEVEGPLGMGGGGRQADDVDAASQPIINISDEAAEPDDGDDLIESVVVGDNNNGGALSLIMLNYRESS